MEQNNIESKIEAAAQKWESATEQYGLGPAIFKEGAHYAMAYAEVSERNKLAALQAKCERYEKALKDIAKQATCVEQENDPERVPDDAGSKLGDIEWGYDCIIRVAREALSAGNGEKEEDNG